MSTLEPDLDALRKTLQVQFQLHMKMGRGEHVYGYAIATEDGREIGSLLKRSKNGKVTSVVYRLGDKHLETAERFLKAYRQQLRDAEFDAAAPAKEAK